MHNLCRVVQLLSEAGPAPIDVIRELAGILDIKR
jgi:hypothetical protein